MMDFQKNINEFKKGVSDGLFKGNSKEGPCNHYYKQGYDFGIALYIELEKEVKQHGGN